MESSRPHTMRLHRTHASGAEEWYCPTCQRRLLMHWSPTYCKVVLEIGDEYATHIGSHSSMVSGATHLAKADAAVFGETSSVAPLQVAEPRLIPMKEELGPVPMTEELRPWLSWMREAGFAA